MCRQSYPENLIVVRQLREIKHYQQREHYNNQSRTEFQYAPCDWLH